LPYGFSYKANCARPGLTSGHVKNYKLRLNPVWHRMLYNSCTYMTTVGVKELKQSYAAAAAVLCADSVRYTIGLL